MAAYIIDAGGAWRRYHPMAVLKGSRMLGTVESDHSDDYSTCTTAAEVHHGRRLRALESGFFTFALDRRRKLLIKTSGADIATMVHRIGMVRYPHAKAIRCRSRT